MPTGGHNLNNMYKELDVVTLTTGERVTILEIYDAGHFLVEEVSADGKGELRDISITDIRKEQLASGSSANPGDQP